MPDYDYRCRDCHANFSIHYDRIAQMEADQNPHCPYCNSTQLSEIIKRVNLISTDEQRLDRLSNPSRFSGNGGSPEDLGHYMRDMSREFGDDMGDEYNEVANRLISGEAPQDMPDYLKDDPSDE